LTSQNGGRAIILKRATLQSSSGRPYISSQIGFAGGRSDDRIASDRLDAGVPTVIFAEFRGLSKDEQQGNLFHPISYEWKK
jgi:hypothetical protein